VTDRPDERGPNDDPRLSDGQIVAQRTAWFAGYMNTRNVFAPLAGGPYSCPCCGHPVLPERGRYEICVECGWEDDGQDDHDSHVVRGGPNGSLSLDDARAAYVARGGLPQPRHPPSDPI
jgi:hypothetical protein